MSTDHKKIQNTLLWILSALMALYFIVMGYAKLSAEQSWLVKFAEWGYPSAPLRVIGGVELVCAIALLIPKIASLGAAILGVITIGAAITHLTHSEFSMVLHPLVFTVFLGVIAWRRRPGGFIT